MGRELLSRELNSSISHLVLSMSIPSLGKQEVRTRSGTMNVGVGDFVVVVILYELAVNPGSHTEVSTWMGGI